MLKCRCSPWKLALPPLPRPPLPPLSPRLPLIPPLLLGWYSSSLIMFLRLSFRLLGSSFVLLSPFCFLWLLSSMCLLSLSRRLPPASSSFFSSGVLYTLGPRSLRLPASLGFEVFGVCPELSSFGSGFWYPASFSSNGSFDNSVSMAVTRRFVSIFGMPSILHSSSVFISKEYILFL